MSIFGNLGQSQPPSAGSMFGNLGGASQPASKSGLNGDIGTSQPPSLPQSSLFGGLSSSAPMASTSTFGATQPAQGSTSLFGAATTSTNNPSGGFGATSGHFGQQAQAAQSQQGASQGAAQALNGPASTQANYFNSLLERGKKRSHPTDSERSGRLGELPSLQLGLDDLARRAREIGAVGDTPQRNGADAKAHYLLANSGITPRKTFDHLRKIDSQTNSTSVPRPVDSFDPDNDRFIRGLQQKGREAMVAESLARVHRDFDAYLEEHLSINFDEQRQKIMEHFGLAQKKDGPAEDPTSQESFGRSTKRGRSQFGGTHSGTRSVLGKSGLEKSIIGSPGVRGSTMNIFADGPESGVVSSPKKGDDRITRDKVSILADKVQRLNQARLSEKSYPLLEELALAEQFGGNDTPRQVVDAYGALKEITQENSPVGNVSQANAMKERQYAPAYLDENRSSANFVQLKKQIIDGSRRFLEQQFYQEINSVVEKNPREAQYGGKPSVANKIRAYIRVRDARKTLTTGDIDTLQKTEEGDYCWALVFFFLRCGFVQQAVDYVEQDQAFRSTDRRFVAYLQQYNSKKDRRLDKRVQDMINGEYQQRLNNAPAGTVDPFRMACYKVVGRCDIERRNLEHIGQSTEDWIWLQFSLAREFDRVEVTAEDEFGLDKICETFEDIGTKHFHRGAEGIGGYGVFFFMQIAAGMFERAISYLHHYSPISAVHFAIALDYYGLLRVADYSVSPNELLTYNTKGLPQINFVPLIGYYTGGFRTAKPEVAVDYLSLICLNADLAGSMGKLQAQHCHDALRELVLETREFAMLLGDIRSDGSRLEGAIERRLKLLKLSDHDSFVKVVTVQAAAVADERGQIADAVLLYHLADDYNSAIATINRALSEAVSVDLGEEPMRIQPLKPRNSADAPFDTSQGSSLSVASADSPLMLADNMFKLYSSNPRDLAKVQEHNKDTCTFLMQMMQAKDSIERGDWSSALAQINNLNVLPIHANGSLPEIRHAAANFSTLQPLVARNTGALLMWSITCIGRERERLAAAAFESTERTQQKQGLAQAARDLMVFAGMVRYKLPPKVFEMLSRAGGEVGGY